MEAMKVIVVGGGSIGSYLATILSNAGHHVTVIEKSDRKVFRPNQKYENLVVVRASGTQPAVLEHAGIEKADVVVATTGDDETNLVVSMLGKFEYGVGRVVARVNNPRNSWLFDKGMGVDAGINQADLIARFVQQDLDIDDVYTLMKLGEGSSSIVQLQVGYGSAVDNERLRDVTLPDDTLLIALNHDGKMSVPNGDTLLRAGDEAVVYVDDDRIPALREAFA